MILQIFNFMSVLTLNFNSKHSSSHLFLLTVILNNSAKLHENQTCIFEKLHTKKECKEKMNEVTNQ